ncbi:unnamed protein product, partial [Laminaria digitata]
SPQSVCLDELWSSSSEEPQKMLGTPLFLHPSKHNFLRAGPAPASDTPMTGLFTTSPSTTSVSPTTCRDETPTALTFNASPAENLDDARDLSQYLPADRAKYVQVSSGRPYQIRPQLPRNHVSPPCLVTLDDISVRKFQVRTV